MQDIVFVVAYIGGMTMLTTMMVAILNSLYKMTGHTINIKANDMSITTYGDDDGDMPMLVSDEESDETQEEGEKHDA